MDADIEPVLLLLAEALGVTDTTTASPWDLMETALTRCGIKVLLPASAQPVAVGKWHRVLKRGDHLLVRRAALCSTKEQVFHHAIFVGEKTLDADTGPDDYVVDMHGPTKEDAALRLRTMTELLDVKGGAELAVMRYAHDSDAKRELSAWLAEESQKRLADRTGLYDLLNGNCDNFATWCRTMRWDPSQLHAIAVFGMDAMSRIPPIKPMHNFFLS
jgi:hypothetical protein